MSDRCYNIMLEYKTTVLLRDGDVLALLYWLGDGLLISLPQKVALFAWRMNEEKFAATTDPDDLCAMFGLTDFWSAQHLPGHIQRYLLDDPEYPPTEELREAALKAIAYYEKHPDADRQFCQSYWEEHLSHEADDISFWDVGTDYDPGLKQALVDVQTAYVNWNN